MPGPTVCGATPSARKDTEVGKGPAGPPGPAGPTPPGGPGGPCDPAGPAGPTGPGAPAMPGTPRGPGAPPRPLAPGSPWDPVVGVAHTAGPICLGDGARRLSAACRARCPVSGSLVSYSEEEEACRSVTDASAQRSVSMRCGASLPCTRTTKGRAEDRQGDQCTRARHQSA